MGAFRCNAGAPQSCQADPTTHCPFWGTTPGQPAQCSASQTCNATNGTCVCNNDPLCGTPATAGDFCPTEGGATHSSCNQGADGCFTVTSGAACAAGTTCQTATTATIVTAGTACGCTPGLADQTGKTIKLVGTGCSAADATAAKRIGSAADDAVLTCKSTGAGSCNTWQITTGCAVQQLTGGTDPVTSLPACVCKAPTVANQYYVDPDPEMSTFMTGQPTGAQFPAACRFRTLTTALAQKGVTEVIAQHTTSSNVHFRTKQGSPSLPNCNAANSCEIFPMVIPPGVHLYTSDVGSFNPLHYVIDVDTTTGAGYAVYLSDKSFVEGYTIDASATNPTLVNAGANVVAVVVTPITGGYTSTPAVAPLTQRLNQVLILSKAIGGTANSGAPATNNQTAFLIQGQSAVQADFLSIVGGSGTSRGIVLDHATDAFAGTTASLVANHLNVSLSGGSTQVNVEVGTNGQSNGIVGPGLAASDAGNILTVTNDAATDGGGAANPHNLRLGSNGVGVHVFNGTATVTGVDVLGNGPGAFTGYWILSSNTPAAKGVNINQGTISGAGTTGAGTGVLATGGLTTVTGTHITGVTGWTGVSVQQVSTTVAGNVTLTGTAAAPTLIDVVTPLANQTATAGIVVGNGAERSLAGLSLTAPAASTTTPRLTIADNTKVTNYVDGVIVNNGHVLSTGTNVIVTANLRDGLQVFSSLALAGTDPNDPLARISINGASFTNNGRLGILIRDVAPVALDTIAVTGNGTPIAGSAFTSFPDGTGGIDIQRSQISGNNTGFLVNLANSKVSGNTGCGITLSGGDDDLVGRTAATGDGVRTCGVGTGYDIVGNARAGAVGGPIVGTKAGTSATATAAGAETPAPLGIFGGRTNVGGKISAFVKNTSVQNNTGVGIYVTEARDFDPAFAVDDVTEVSLQNNLVTGNLTVVPPAGQEPVSGGVYFAPSNFTRTNTAGTRALAVSDIGCEDPSVTSTGHTICTRIRMSSFLGNTISCNGRSQLSFGLPQRISTSADGTPPDGDWDISSDGTIVGVDLTMRCSAAASPNTLAGYSSTAASLGLAIPGTATTNTGVSLVHVHAYGVKWNSGTIISGSDYSSALSASPQGNDDATTWGICAGGAPTTCPVALK